MRRLLNNDIAILYVKHDIIMIIIIITPLCFCDVELNVVNRNERRKDLQKYVIKIKKTNFTDSHFFSFLMNLLKCHSYFIFIYLFFHKSDKLMKKPKLPVDIQEFLRLIFSVTNSFHFF